MASFLRKLSFWKKSSKVSAVEHFQPEDQLETLGEVKKGVPTMSKLAPASTVSTPQAALVSVPQEAVAENVSPAAKVSSPVVSDPHDGHESVPIPEGPMPGSPVKPPPPRSAPDEGASPSRTREKSSSPKASRPSKSRVTFEEPSTRTPSPSEYDEDSLNFDATLEQTRAGVSEAFGQMIASSLQSTKWDKRSQAMKAIMQVLKGLDVQGAVAPPGSTGVLGKGLKLRDRTRCWRLSCQLLNHFMIDKVMPVRLAALDLFQDTFANVEGIEAVEVRYAAGVLVEHLIDKVGDSNVRLHEGSRKCVLFCAEHPGLLGLGTVLERLKSKIDSCPKTGKGGDRSKVHFGVLDTVSVLLEHFPGRRQKPNSPKSDESDIEDEEGRSSEDSWTAEDISGFIIAGMDDSLGPRVRNVAVSLAGAVFSTFGMESMEPILQQLRPAKQNLLKQKFKELEEDHLPEEDDDAEGDGEVRPDLDGFLVCGAAVQPTPTAASQPTGGDEECLMDGILEEAGMVFNGTGIVNEAARSPHFGREEESFMDDLEDFEEALLEEELLGLNLDEIEDLDEQQALLSSLADLEGSQSRSHLSDNLSVEVF
mmetsp:Transcript_31616/g.57500  ORF Transcript_31616/g.57500 Transcript_31616/m.57500 type:complete len:592 (-) Transcript_31616:193-1968(-)|eukprot:CAMPEP_0197627824 /NCGR_PEP_ID=MMETSP1338-20131121/6326_1 /TAXON_ID=43686 ORGANISM="Pelagodinium beii, Strain RCC1491" /NCGR_SAMPLE_ID=MMETSP1338 /ASSEMBLY_ACC=CAM_ASM_000754 /LENGTH=591 /DNA_ID=CAMNT_0043198651 /DNA_START=126 /DNA_END=1901 /DNA_ORIENTATION=-